MKRLDMWQEYTIPGDPSIYGIDYGRNTFVAVGHGIFTSHDGITWARQPTVYGNSPCIITDVAFSGNTFVAVTNDNVQYDWFPFVALISIDGGNTWTSSGMSTASTFFPSAVTADGTTIIAVGTGQVMGDGIVLSMDGGAHWQAVSLPVNGYIQQFSDICKGTSPSGQRLFVAVGQATIQNLALQPGCFYSAVSTDGNTWSEFLGGPGGFRSVAYGNGVFVAVGSNDIFYISRDGIKWTGRAYRVPSPVYKITFAEGYFVAVGEDGRVYDSPDGDKWSMRVAYAGKALHEIHYCRNAFVAGDEQGHIFLSERYDQPFLSVQIQGSGSVISQPPGKRFIRDWGATFPAGSVVNLSAQGEHFKVSITGPDGHKFSIPSPVFTVFSGWSGAVTTNSSMTQITLDQDRAVVAHFEIFKPKLPLDVGRPSLPELIS